jgi:hypothetical protein
MKQKKCVTKNCHYIKIAKLLYTEIEVLKKINYKLAERIDKNNTAHIVAWAQMEIENEKEKS